MIWKVDWMIRLTCCVNCYNAEISIRMKATNFLYVLILALLAFILTGCELIGDIFSAGVYTGVFIVVLFIALIIYAVMRFGKRD